MTWPRWSVVAALVGLLLVTWVDLAVAEEADDYEPGPCIGNGGIGGEQFVDVAPGAFYYDAVRWAFANGITQGVEPAHFAPNRGVTRGEFATMLHRMACLPAPNGTADFGDLRPGAFYRAAVDWLVGERITTGKTTTRFGPDDFTTRGELATFLHRFAGEPTGAPESPFADNTPGRFFAEGVDWLVLRSVTLGTSPTTFSPWRPITRAEVVTFLHRFNTIGDLALRLDPVVTGLAAPTSAATDPVNGAVFLTERGGRVLRYTAGGDGRPDWSTGTVVRDISGSLGQSGEGGLLGSAVAPDSSALFLSYTNGAGDSVIRRFPLLFGVPFGASEVVITVDQPQSNHNGGQIVFGPDGHLYTSFGDGGGGNDDGAGHTEGVGNGQDPDVVLGKILRLAPRAGGGYDVPADNPLVGVDGRDEIWATGVRNPWRFTFDSATGDLWVADVGQDRREEITRLRASEMPGPAGGRGANLGWRLREGDISTPGVGGPAPAGHAEPVHVYAHPSSGCVSITGGYVYRGADIPALQGTYVYGDYCLSSRLRGWRDSYGVEAETFSVSVPGGNLVSFLEDGTGELYSISLNGTISRLTRATSQRARRRARTAGIRR